MPPSQPLSPKCTASPKGLYNVLVINLFDMCGNKYIRAEVKQIVQQKENIGHSFMSMAINVQRKRHSNVEDKMGERHQRLQ
ncbi:hypothetical protein M422DRAFT_257670 [Sphaerobolus stellatus SS14]|uniref:Uncharacterized protein n=1 Tax=Sphaerobolus stellatus (strain SS14) TaxID=990650 RepID=A0A0C9VNG5_SPHS4|nr:hypothetical protein M422DRAFT_257670 [Sphaerobolus stellatus SS14]